MTGAEPVTSQRRIRPWIAALLTFVGWGLGLFYARRTRAAIWWAVANILVSIAIGLGVFTYAVATHQSPLPLLAPSGFSFIDLAGMGIAAILAVWVWITTSKTRFVSKSSPTRLWGYLGIFLLPVVVSLSLAFVIRVTLFQPFRTPAGSMQPALNVGDYFAATKWSYGYSRFSIAPLDGVFPNGRILAHSPKRGDIVVFRSTVQGRDLVKRIIGMPGDRIQISHGALSINGKAAQREDLRTKAYVDADGEPVTIQTYRETLPNGVSYLTLDRDPNGFLDNTRVFVVPKNAFFVLGDDRDNSADSRVPEVGYVAFDALIGRVDYIMPPTQ